MKRHLTCGLCEALCGLEVELDDEGGVAEIRGDKLDPLSAGHLCPKAVALQDIHNDPDRLRAPLKKTSGGWEAISWEDALEEVATRIVDIQAEGGRDAVGIYVGNPMAHNYSAILALQAFKEVLATRHLTSATSVDQLPHMFCALKMFGHQLLLPVPDIDRTDLLVVMGANPLASNGSLMTAPGIRRRLTAIGARGGRVVVLDPRRTETASFADEHHFVRPGTDALLLLAIVHVLFETESVSKGRWRGFVKGLDLVREVCRGFGPQRVSAAVGMEPDAIKELALALAMTPRAALYGRFGVCTQRFGGLSAWLISVINILAGNLDEPGGLMFARPAADLVSISSLLGQQGSHKTWLSRVAQLPEFGGELPVSALAQEILTPGDGQIKAMITVAGNPVLSTPNGGQLDRALRSLDYMVSLDHYVNETTCHADLILPPVSPLERDHFGLVFHMLAVRNTVKFSPALFDVASGDTRHDWETVLEIGRRVLRKRGGAKGRLGALGLAALHKMGPRRWLDMGLRFGPYKRMSLKRLLSHPHGIDLGPLSSAMPGRLKTSDGLIDLAPSDLVADVERLRGALESGSLLPESGELLLVGRRHLRSLNSWMHNSERLVRGKGRCTLMINPVDAATQGLCCGEMVVLSSRTGEVEVAIEISDEMMPGVVSLPHGWGHQREGVRLKVASKRPGVSLNDLTDEEHIDSLTGTAGFSGVRVRVEPIRSRSMD